jgi:stage V sporulation protein R
LKLKHLSSELVKAQEVIEGHAREFGLTFFRTVFEMVDYEQMNALAAFGGFPTRYPHYRFGMEYQQLSKSYEYGLHKIYEMVINNDPTYAYLLEGNMALDQKLVMAHVYGHADFFLNNMYFSHTNRKMMDEMANHATRVRRYQERYGVETVERWIDACLCVEDLIDPGSVFADVDPEPRAAERDAEEPGVVRMPAKDYLDRYVNPPEYMQEQAERLAREKAEEKRFPPSLDRARHEALRQPYRAGGAKVTLPKRQ